ncbi:MAG: alpha/beta hydrolase [Methanobrevibacter sp.]|nr:alpha/beta hydrolase [Methanobrevibacter sp.]
MLTIHEFGQNNAKTIVMFHPLGVWWDIFEYVIPILEKDYHLIVPAIPGHDPDRPESDYTSMQEITDEMTDFLTDNGLGHVDCLYGCSMGGGLVIKFLAEGKINTDLAIIDAGMTPYQLPKPITYLIGIRDFLMTMMGKYASIKMLGSVFDPEKYSQEDLLYVKKVLNSLSARTIWKGFYEANNYTLPEDIVQPDCRIQYWYGDEEKDARGWDMEFVKKTFPNVEFVENTGQNHAEFFTLHPEEFCLRIDELLM